MRRLTTLTLLGVLAVGGALSACGTETGAGAGRPAGGEGDVPITPAAIAAVAVDHLPRSASSMVASYRDQRSPKGYVGADLRYGADGVDDGDLVRVSLQPHRDEQVCGNTYDDGCVELDGAPAGSRVFLTWQEVEPEEDPGIVVVVLQRAAEDVVVLTAGQEIEGDPREQDLAVPVEVMQELAQDDRLHLAATQEVVDAGESLDGFDPGDYDPTAYDRVPATDAALAGVYVTGHGGYLAFSGQRPSPLKADFGDGAVGSRLERDLGGYTATIDVLASPQLPAWMSRDVCATPRFAGHCRALPPGPKGARYLAWEPGDDGQVWGIAVRPDEVVAIHQSGYRVSERAYGVVVRSEWFLDRGLLNRTRTLGLTTQRELVDFDLEALQAEGSTE
ncbi:hypothetical protein H5V45_05065 [Nocardioides sp. KIGAM211]|uniref:Uncharacterized protein n=1 Tax=Nocardioides luti TaxID=2761101 RepID=A0A7X0RGP6_9ACTN|nr:hypothetical protein [Nocardioides luti]MBB6626689.1 hypothetical protein [Nocardioides luti]